VIFFAAIFPFEPLRAQAGAESFTETRNATLFAEIGGYIPFKDSYKINYGTNTIGLPVELSIGMLFPASERLSAGAILRYKRREANFVSNMSISTVELYPSVMYYLEQPQFNELLLYGRAGLLLARSVAKGESLVTKDGSDPIESTVSKDYYNIGFGIGLGLEYPLNNYSTLFADLHVGMYFADPVKGGGLGNIGGVTIGVGYSIGF
jgi:opacity protein-like surface antigen